MNIYNVLYNFILIIYKISTNNIHRIRVKSIFKKNLEIFYVFNHNIFKIVSCRKMVDYFYWFADKDKIVNNIDNI